MLEMIESWQNITGMKLSNKIEVAEFFLYILFTYQSQSVQLKLFVKKFCSVTFFLEMEKSSG